MRETEVIGFKKGDCGEITIGPATNLKTTMQITHLPIITTSACSTENVLRAAEELRQANEEMDAARCFFGAFKAYKTPAEQLEVEKIIVNGDATIVFWKDGDKTIVKKSADDEYDLHHAFCSALAKKVYGHNSTVKKMVQRKTKVQKPTVKNLALTDIAKRLHEYADKSNVELAAAVDSLISVLFGIDHGEYSD